MVEVIGCVISLLALLYLFLNENRPPLEQQVPLPPKISKRSYAEERRVKNKAEKELSEQRIKDHPLRSIVKPPPPPVCNLPSSSSLLRLEEHEKIAPSKVQVMVQRLNRRRDMLVYQEIIDKPKSMRPDL